MSAKRNRFRNGRKIGRQLPYTKKEYSDFRRLCPKKLFDFPKIMHENLHGNV
jgi:hypothetical protein